MTRSDRQHDAFDNYSAKAQCRDGKLRVRREAAHLLWEDDGRSLRCDSCELMGATGLLTSWSRSLLLNVVRAAISQRGHVA